MPREWQAGGVIDFNGGTQQGSWGVVMTAFTPITCSFLLNLRVSGSASFDTVWGYSKQKWFFLLNGSNPRRIAFNVITGVADEKTSGYITSDLALGTWYTVVGGYDPAGGASNHFIKVYSMDGTSYGTAVATSTGALTTATNSLIAGSDPVLVRPVNAQMANFRVWNRVLLSTEHDAIALNDPTGWTRESLQVETLCDGSGQTLLDTANNVHLRACTLSGGAVTKQEKPAPFAHPRLLIA